MSQIMFGTNMFWFIIVLFVVHVILVFIHVGIILVKPYNTLNWKILFFIVFVMIQTILVSSFAANFYSISLFFENSIVFSSCVFLNAYYLSIFLEEIGVNRMKYLTPKLISLVFLSVYFFTYVLLTLITGDDSLARLFTLPVLLISVISFCSILINQVYFHFKRGGLQLSSLLSIAGVLFISTTSVLTLLNNTKGLVLIFTNAGLLLIIVKYYWGIICQASQEKKNHCSVKSIHDLSLTPREVEVASLILQGYSYSIIGEQIHINHKTVSKHASNIFKKTGCCNKEEFSVKYSLLIENQ